MPYAIKFYAYIFVANVLAFVIVAWWVRPFGFMASVVFGLAVISGRWVLGRKRL
jgi:hypothetical protein